MRAKPISACAVALLMTLCAGPALAAEVAPKPSTVDNKPGSPTVSPPSSQRDLTRPAPTVTPTTDSVDQRGPAARTDGLKASIEKQEQAIKDREASLKKKEAELAELIADRDYRARVEKARADLAQRYEAERAALDAKAKEVSEKLARIGSQLERRSDGHLYIGADRIVLQGRTTEEQGAYLDSVLRQRRAEFERVSREEGGPIAKRISELDAQKASLLKTIADREKKHDEDRDSAVKKLEGEIAKEVQALGSAKLANTEALADAERTRFEVARLRAQADELDGKVKEAERRGASSREILAIMAEAHERRVIAKQMEMRQQGHSVSETRTTTEGLLDQSMDKIGR